MRQMGQTYWSALSTLRPCWCILGQYSFLKGFVAVHLPLCVCVYVLTCMPDILGKSSERGQIVASFSHIIAQLPFIHKSKSTAPPSTCPSRYDTCLCPLMPSKNIHNTHSVYAGECNASCGSEV